MKQIMTMTVKENLVGIPDKIYQMVSNQLKKLELTDDCYELPEHIHSKSTKVSFLIKTKYIIYHIYGDLELWDNGYDVDYIHISTAIQDSAGEFLCDVENDFNNNILEKIINDGK